MEALRIYRKDLNIEIVSKLMNSVAKKYECRVRYNAAQHAIRFYGDEACKSYIVEEMLGFFKPSPEGA